MQTWKSKRFIEYLSMVGTTLETPAGGRAFIHDRPELCDNRILSHKKFHKPYDGTIPKHTAPQGQ